MRHRVFFIAGLRKAKGDERLRQLEQVNYHSS
jgi:hypothetical protein